MTKELYCPKCYSFKVTKTFCIGESKNWNIVCKCGYSGLALKDTKEFVKGLKRFSK